MILLLVCILSSVAIAVLFKLFPLFKVNTLHAIVFNYLTCLLVGTIQLGQFPIPLNIGAQAWFPYVFFLGCLFISGFNFNAMATQRIGISYTTLIQKLSLVAPAAVAILFYNESLTTLKLLGILGAMAAIILIQLPSRDPAHAETVIKKHTLLILGVFVIAAIIEVCLFYMNVNGISTGSDIAVVSSIFGIAGGIGLILMIARIGLGKDKWEWRNVGAGILLGIPNFYSIYLLLYLLASGWEASKLFPINNVGIIAIAAIVALLFFKEKLNLFKWVGLLLAIVSIVLISR